MAGKVPYYYSDLTGKAGAAKKAAAAAEEAAMGVAEPDQAPPEEKPPIAVPEPIYSEDPESGLPGFYNPLLSIEPDISMGDSHETRRKMSLTQKKKKKKKKKSGYGSFYKQSNSSTTNGNRDVKSPTRSARLPLPSERIYGFRTQRRNSEPNLYEEIPENVVEEGGGGGGNTVCYSGSLAGFAQHHQSQQQRRKSSGPHYSSSGRLPEVLDEVQEVHQKHALILENLNLDFETMLMPESGSRTSEGVNHSSNFPNKLSLGKKSSLACHIGSKETASQECLVSSTTQWPTPKIYADPAALLNRQHRNNDYSTNQSEGWMNVNASSSSGENVYYQHHRCQRELGGPGGDDNIYEEVDHVAIHGGGHPHMGENGGCCPGEELSDRLSWSSTNFLENNLAHSGSELEEEEPAQSAPGSFAQRIISLKGGGKKRTKKKDSDSITSGFTRWFSTRRKEYELEKMNKLNIKPPTEDNYGDIKMSKKQRPPLTLPPPISGLNHEQVKRRLIVQSIVDSENSYVSSLQRLIKDYKRPLEESSPPIISPSKLSIMFYRVEQILQCHSIFGIALTQCVREWDYAEKIGDVFVASFSKAMVLDIYSDFINNFSMAMDTAKQASKNKSAFAEFLKAKQVTSPDRLSFFGLMVKPVQRFPQFILLLQDLLKHTPGGHHDRMSLQLALTQLELLADTLNERKRESEQYHAVREVMKHLGNKFALKSLSDGHHFLLRQDDVIQLDMDQNGMVIKSKSRRIYLLNDLLVCVSVSPRSTDGVNSTERFSLKWAVPLNEVEVEEDVAPATKNLMAVSGRARNAPNRTSSGSLGERNSGGSLAVQALYDDLSDLVHDLEVMSRISSLVGTLRRPYPGLTNSTVQEVSLSIQEGIRKKDDEITLLDSCCLQLVLPVKPKGSKEVLCFQMMTPGIKLDWITDLRLAKLAMDASNAPSWDVQEQEKRPSSKMPLFVKTFPVHSGEINSEVKCGCYYAVCSSDGSGGHCQNLVCLVSGDGINSHVVVMTIRLTRVKRIGGVTLNEVSILCLEAAPSFSTEMGNLGGVPPTSYYPQPSPQPPATDEPRSNEDGGQQNEAFVGGLEETLWVGTQDRRILLVEGRNPEEWQELGEVSVASPVLHIKYLCRHVFAALSNGSVLIFRRNSGGIWDMEGPEIVTLGTEAVTCLLPIGQSLYCACESKVWVIDAPSREVQRSYSLGPGHEGDANLLAHSGTGLWIALRNSATICLYHTETFHHLQDINIAANVNRLLAGNPIYAHLQETPVTLPDIFVTSLMATRGLLWVGTNVGVVVTIPMPRLEGVPIISGRSNVAYHAHLGPVSFLLSLQQRTVVTSSTLPVPHDEEAIVSAPASPNANVNGDNGSPGSTASGAAAKSSQDSVELKSDAELFDGGTHSKVNKQKSDSLLPSGWLGRKIMGQGGRPSSALNSVGEVHMSGAKTLPRGMTFCRPNYVATPHQTMPDSDNDVYGLYADLMNVQDYEKDSQEKLYERLNHSDPELVHFHLATLDRRLQSKSGRPRSWDLSNMAVSEDSDSSAIYDASSVAPSSVSCPEARTMHQQSGGGGVGVASSANPQPIYQQNLRATQHHLNQQPKMQIQNQQKAHTMAMTNTAVNAAMAKNQSNARATHRRLPKHLIDPAQKTVLVLTGGSGYANWRWCERDLANESNRGGDSHVILWEMKL